MSYRADICRQIIELDWARENKYSEMKRIQLKLELIKLNPLDSEVVFYTPSGLEKELNEVIKFLDDKEKEIKSLINFL